jgi:putative transcriptional regulator
MQTIRELREAHGWTQRELAAKMDVTITSVSAWERRTYEPRAIQLRRLAQLFGVSMDDIDFEADEGKELAA